ncbi:hypothetical protein CEXT_628451 [Caerostris extrusa]|uniref:Uncharacterized protein n=1 Tax=Caerostris extrusa TaxID=172846 RepID=A0AAV4W7Q2_CAEEX|nr:hypothetical protein CEXT_628451 [Caerostris extrusa]
MEPPARLKVRSSPPDGAISMIQSMERNFPGKLFTSINLPMEQSSRWSHQHDSNSPQMEPSAYSKHEEDLNLKMRRLPTTHSR